MSSLRVAVVVLTMGERTRELTTLAASIRDEQLDERHLVVNGGRAVAPDGWEVTQLDTNLGVPGGRSAGVHATTADVIVFLDDDNVLAYPGLIARVRERFEAHDSLGALAFHVRGLGGSAPLRRWIPQSARPDEFGLRPSVTFPGNGHALRRSALEDVGGYCDELFFKHEETDLAWRLLDSGWEVAYDPQCVVEHPITEEARHRSVHRLGLRNRIWMARMQLPVPIAVASIVVVVTRTALGIRSLSDARKCAAGFRDGFTTPPRSRKPMSWSTVKSLTSRGRPPIF